jgi:hypothetical protein
MVWMKRGCEMPKSKQHVFSSSMTEEGLMVLKGIRQECCIGWDELIIYTVCAYYGLDKVVMALSKMEKQAEKFEEK